MARRLSEKVILNEIQLLLSEKRTYLSVLRTGLTLFTVPLTVIAVMAATSSYHRIFNTFVTGFLTTATLLFISLVGLVIFFRAEARIKRVEKMVQEKGGENARVTELLI